MIKHVGVVIIPNLRHLKTDLFLFKLARIIFVVKLFSQILLIISNFETKNVNFFVKLAIFIIKISSIRIYYLQNS